MGSNIYATWGDVTTTYEGTIPLTAKPRIEALLRRASSRLTALVPSLPVRLSDGTLDPDLPLGLVVDAVLNVYRNPSGTTQQGVGPFSQSFPAQKARSEIHFDEEDLRKLLIETGIDSGAVVGSIEVLIPGLHRGVYAQTDAARYFYTPEQLRGH
jgi:hypothetical protein